MTSRTALITGASRGPRPRPRHRPRPTAAGGSSSTPATPAGSTATVAALARPDLVTAVAGDVADPAHRAALADGRRRRGSTCSSTTPATSAPARCRRLADLDRRALRRRPGRQRRRPARARSRPCCPRCERAGGPGAGHQLRRRRRGLRRAGAATAPPRRRSTSSPPSSPSSTRSCASTRSTPATWPPTCTRPPSPARTSATARPRRPSSRRCSRLVDGDLPSGRYRAADLRRRRR